jgi:3-(3-hydroxy-phenyl)propionate hydroxylase
VKPLLPVVIVGAGPTGMTAALDLAHYGIHSLVLDEDHRLSDGSRALAYHGSTLSVWEKFGAAEEMLKQGINWSVRHTYRGEKKLYEQNFGLPAPGFMPRYINLPQADVERYLLDKIVSNPLIDLRWDHKVVGFSQTDESATLDLETPHGPLRLSALYVLACDGARSTMRKLLDLDFPGRTFNDYFLIADIKADLNFPHEPRFFFDHPTNPGKTVLIHPQPEGIWRIDWQIGSNANTMAETTPEKMKQRIQALIGDTPYETVWLSAYRFHQRLLKLLSQGRVFFAGDAAHLVAPFGARGMNSAVQDVENLGWKLAYVLNGLAPVGLLDTYHSERWAAQSENQRVTITTMRFMAPNTPWLRLRRNLILWLSGFYPAARKLVDSGKMSIPYTYTDSPLIALDSPCESWENAPVLGAKPSDASLAVVCDGQVQTTFLRRLFGSGFVALHFTDSAEGLLPALEKNPPQFPLKIYPVVSRPNDTQGESILDADYSLANTFSAQGGTLYLFRPDGHLALRRKKGEAQDILAYFEKLQRL